MQNSFRMRHRKCVFEKDRFLTFCFVEKDTIINFLSFLKMLNFWQVASIRF